VTPNVYLYGGEQVDLQANLYYLRARYLNSQRGRFVSADPVLGEDHDPTSLHKYLYAHVNPMSVRDPSGMFSLMDITAAQAIRLELIGVQLNFGSAIIDRLLNPDADANRAIQDTIVGSAFSAGAALISSRVAFSYLRFLRNIVHVETGAGWVRYARSYPEDQVTPKKALDTALHIAQRLGLKLHLREFGIRGADAIVVSGIRGVSWEIKNLSAGTNSAVSDAIKDSFAKEQSSRIIIDGSKVGLTRDTLYEGIFRARRDGRVPSEVIGVLEDGEIELVVPAGVKAWGREGFVLGPFGLW